MLRSKSGNTLLHASCERSRAHALHSPSDSSSSTTSSQRPRSSSASANASSTQNTQSSSNASSTEMPPDAHGVAATLSTSEITALLQSLSMQGGLGGAELLSGYLGEGAGPLAGASVCPALLHDFAQLPGGHSASSQLSNSSGSRSGASSSRTPAGPARVHALYKTELCKGWLNTGTCRYGTKCQFAHGRDELRAVPRHPKYKTELCRSFSTTGSCPYGPRCRFIHSRPLHAESPHTMPGFDTDYLSSPALSLLSDSPAQSSALSSPLMTPDWPLGALLGLCSPSPRGTSSASASTEANRLLMGSPFEFPSQSHMQSSGSLDGVGALPAHASADSYSPTGPSSLLDSVRSTTTVENTPRSTEYSRTHSSPALFPDLQLGCSLFTPGPPSPYDSSLYAPSSAPSSGSHAQPDLKHGAASSPSLTSTQRKPEGMTNVEASHTDHTPQCKLSEVLPSSPAVEDAIIKAGGSVEQRAPAPISLEALLTALRFSAPLESHDSEDAREV